MADKINPTASPKAMQNKAQEALEKQVAELKREFARINKMLIDRSKEAAGQVNTLPTQAQSVSEVVRANPGTLSSAMIVGILIGFAVGFVVGQSQVTGSRHRWY